MALSGGEQLALGLGLAVEKTGSTSGYSGNAAVSVNLIDHEVEALHENNTVEKAEDVNVSAYARDIENTGGGSLGAGQQKVGVGATVGVAMLNNNITAGIKGGEYKYVGNVDVEALNALQNITVGIAAGLTLPSSGSGASAVVEGAGVYNEVHNTTNAFITGTENGNDVDNIVISTVDGGSVNVTAQDVAVVKTYEDILTDGLADGKEEIAKRMGKNFEITGKNELAGVEMGDAETELNKNKADNKKEETVDIYKLDEEGKTTGSSIITVAGGLAATTGKGAGGAAVAITDIENTYTADVKYADITADELDVDAGSNSNIVTVAGGIAAANKGSGVGSVTWNVVENTAKANIKDSVVNAQTTLAKAVNKAQIVSVAGQISGAGKAGVGATLSYIGLDNSTEANITSTTFDKRDKEETEGITVSADATNTSDSYNIGAGVSAAGTAAVSGTVVVTQTHGTAGAVMDGVTINNAKTVTANALDNTDILSVIGNATASGKAAVGAGVAYTEIGDVSTNPDNGQYVTAEIKNSTINSDGADSTVEVKAKDEARVINVAIGVGGAGNVAVQGASATTLINKETSAGINSTNIDAGHEGSTKANVTVDAQNSSKITSSADVAAAAGSGAGVGAGIAVNRIIQQTNAAVNGGTMNVNNLTVNANATPQITNIGVGVGVAGSGAGVTGSVAVNMIENNVTARIGSGATIVADGTVGVVATSDEQIANYAGQASVAGTGAAVGLSVSYNELTGNTTAIIDGDTTSVSASGGDALTVKDSVADNSILDNVVDEDAFDSQNTLGNDRSESEYKGVAVSASSTHAIKSFIINAGVAGTGAAVNGTVNVNQIGGSTKAAITGANINKDNANAAGNVNVIAHDYTNSAGMVGTASITGTGAGIGLGSDTNTVSREVTAEVSGKAKDNKNIINAADFNVDANAKQGISSLTVSAAGAGIGVGLSNATSVALLKGKTTAKVNNANITASSVNVAANHTGKLNTMGTVLGVAGAGAGVSVGVSVLNENSETVAEVSGGDITITNDAESNNIKVKAANSTKVDYNLYTASAGLAGVAGAIGVSNINSRVKTNVADVVMSDSKADDINIGAENAINFTNTSGSGAGGAVGFGGGVAVNTVDSQVTTTVTNAQLNAANDINVTAQETRKVNQMTVNAGAGLVAGGANVMITNVGSAVADSYGSGLQTDNDGQVQDNSGINTATIFDKANEAVEGNKLKDGDTYGVQVNNVPDVKATKGTDGASVVEVNINESTLNAGNKVTAEAVADTNVTMNTVQASGAAVISATGTVGILDVNRNSVVNINNTTINAKDLAVSTTQKGTSNLSIYQGNVGGAGSIGAAYGSASSTGVNNISVSGSTLNVDSNVDINANDESKTAVDAFGVTLAGGGAASIIVAQGSNNSSTNIDVNDTDIYAGEDIDIHAERQAKDEKGNKVDSLSVSAKAMSGGLMFAGAGVGATANELGKVGVTVADDSNFTAGSDINITALNAPSVSATTGSLSGSMLASGAITVAEANIGTHIEPEDKENENKEDNGHLKTFVNITEGNSFTAKSLTAEAKADAVQNVTMDGISISASLPMFPSGAVQANAGSAKAYSDVTVTVGENVFKGNETGENAKGINLNIKGINNVTQRANAKGISVSTYFASGTNIAETKSVLDTDVTVGGAATSENVDENSKVNNVDISAESTAKVESNARGDGGGLVDISPYAAKTDNDINSTTNVTVGGNWDIAGDMYVNALHTDNVTLNTDAVKAAVVGASGVHSDNDITNNTSVTFDNATVTTGGDQNISARNDITYKADITGSGYGVATGAAVWAQDDITSNANVNVTGSHLEADGSITMDALTGDAYYEGVEKPKAAINKNVTIKSAGVVAGTYAESNDTINFTNNINVGAGSSIATVGTETDNADITLTAADRTNFNDITTADTQGGVIGAAGTQMTNNITRTNNINVGGTVDSNYDANFDAGDSSVLNLTLKSNAYNKTAAPLATIPSISGTMTQNSSIDFETGSSVRSLRNINAAAGVGDTTIAKESKTWRWVDGGETGTGSIASTSDGTLSGGDAVINTTVTVDGSLEAGKNYQLDITIEYADGGKQNMEKAFDEYGKDITKYGDDLKAAQQAYDDDINVKTMYDKAETLAEKEDKLLNDTNVQAQLTTEKGRLGEKLDKAEIDKTVAKTDLNNYIDEKWAAFDKTQSSENRIEKDEYVNKYLVNDSNYQSKLSNYNDALDKIADLNEKINRKNEEIATYTQNNTALQKEITDLKGEIDRLRKNPVVVEKLDNLNEAKALYNEALEKGLSEDLVNEAVFKGQLDNEKGEYEKGDYVIIDAPKWYKDQYGSAAEQIGMIDYAASLLKRMDDLIKMSQQYTGTDVGDAYTAELSRIQSDLQALGLLTVDSEGNIGIAQGASSVPTIELKDLLVSGGNVNISADTLNSAETGSITAHGNPSVSITNNTDFFLRVNDVKIAGDGGSIKYNDAALTEDVFNGTIKAEQGSGKAKISINNTSGTSKSDELTQYDETLYTPDIGIYGEIYNPYGNIEITNAHNNIYVAGEVKDEDGNVTQKAGSIVGQTINLTAGGSVTQGYSDEIYNVAGDPKNALSTESEYITAIQNALIEALGTKKDEAGQYYVAFDIGEGDAEEDRVANLAKFLIGLKVNDKELGEADALQAAKQLTGYVENDKPGIAAGGAIYINAASINVNGTIQSGFEDYKLAIDQKKAAQLIKDGNTTGKENLTYEDFMTDTWRVTADGQSGAYYDEDSKTFVYGIQAWYNPITNEIFTEDIEQAGGGRIYLTGAIANTNASGGKLVVLDGGSDYTIDGSVATEKKYTFKLGSINAETVDGLIKITDTSDPENVRITEYTKKSTFTVDDNGKATYNPTEGLYYNWSNGTSSRVTTSYKHVSDSSWWGLSSSSWESVVGQLDEVTKDQMIDTTFGNNGVEETTGQQLGMGNIITDGSVDGYTQLGTANSGTTAVNGSTAKNDNTLYQIMFERQGERKQGRNDKGDLLYLNADGELTTDPNGNTPYYLKDENGNYIYETVISDKVTTTKKKGLLGLWGKTVTTEWKETSGMITAYNFGLKADNSIGIEFVGNENGSIGTIKSNSDILLGGDIHMGQVEITSGGSINHVDTATVISDNASFKAETGIDVIVKNEANPSKLNGTDTLGLDGEELGNPLHLKATTTSGNINIQAVAANEYKDVYIDDVSTGKGNVTITAEGSLLNGKLTNDYAVSGDGITLQSYGGSIGSNNEKYGGSLLIDGDVSYVADSDKNHGAINANAAGSVYLNEVDGNMYLGEIVAEGLDKNGNVVLEVSGDGAGFVDAIVNNSNDNKDDNRIEEWKKLGLLGDDTKDKTQNNQSNQLTNLENAALNGSMFMDEEGTVSFELAQEQGAKLVETGKNFVEQMEGANATVQKARENLNTAQGKLNEAIADLNDKKEGSEAAYKTALEKYNNAYDAYEKASADYEQQKADFIASSGFAGNTKAEDWLTNYEAIGNAQADNYGWTQQQLLYAVQDTVINPNAGSVSDVKTANVTGNNITFISDTGNLGVVDTQETVIKTDKLAELFTKGTLSDAEKAQLDKLASARAGDVTWGDKKITIERTTPVSVKLNGDGGTVTVEKNSADGKIADHIYLLAKDSVLNADEFAANDLRLSGQEGLNVGSVTGEKIYLEGGSGDIGHKVNDALQAVQVTLKDNGFISANAAGNVALQQVLEDTGKIVDFTLGSVAGKNVDIDAVGSIVSRKDDIGYINASETIDLTSTTGGIGTETDGLRIKNSGAVVNTDVKEAINIEAKQDGTLILGTMKQADGGVNVDSEGSIYIGREDNTETTDEDEYVEGYIDAKDNVNLHAAEDIIISGMLHVNKDNGNLNLHADNGDITQTTSEATENIAVDNLTVAAIGGDVKLDNPYNVIEKVDLQAVGGSLGLTVSNADGFNVDMGGFTNKKGGDVSFTNSNGSVNITTEDIENPEEQDPANINGSLTVTAKKDKDTDTAENADINNKGILNATENITFKAADDIYNNIVTANEKIEFTATDGVINSDTVNGKDVIMQAIEQELENILAKDSVTLNGDRIHGQNITQNTEADGDLIINTDSNSGSGPIESLVIDKIDANDKSVFTELWAVEANITTVDDKMDFNDIMIEENAWLENSGTLATIYGNVPVKDDDANVHIYQSYPSMYVNFIDADTVETDGRLLSLDDYWYAYDQRFTAENHLRWQHGRYLDEDWKQAYGYGLSLHNRYGLIDYQEFTETNAGADEVAVEA